ncbi:MAG: hypothetical protein ABS79_01480 [Planctomycetes bacterium SCN 63-9]|nr:MAG: hypothetical protein ABS79_01480 [Planctomycetes bacterium SCN 63-9]
MLHISSCIEQLHLSANQLHQDNAAYRRFSLILTDNIVELMAYRRCRQEFIHDEKPWGAAVYSADERKKVLGNDFGAKINFLVKIGLLSSDDQTYINQCHSYRNESYHVGIVHDDILHAVAWHYHKTACDLFVRLRLSVIAGNIHTIESETVRRHTSGIKMFPFFEDDFVAIAQSLSRERPEPEPNLQDVLSNSALRRIDHVQEAMDYLREDNGQEEVDLVRELQYWRDFADNHPSTDGLTDEDAAKVRDQWKKDMDANWKPKLRTSPVTRYRKRAIALQSTVNASNALQNFETLKRDMEPFAELVLNAAQEYSDHIQNQIDAARGK